VLAKERAGRLRNRENNKYNVFLPRRGKRPRWRSSGPALPPRDGCSSASVTAGSHRAGHGNGDGECPGVCRAGLRGQSRPAPYCSSFGTSTCRRRRPVTGGDWDAGRGWGPGVDPPRRGRAPLPAAPGGAQHSTATSSAWPEWLSPRSRSWAVGPGPPPG